MANRVRVSGGEMNASFKHPFTYIVVRPAGCGKTAIVAPLLRPRSWSDDCASPRVGLSYYAKRLEKRQQGR